MSEGLLPNSFVTDLKLIENYVYATINGNGLWRRNLDEFPLGIEENRNPISISIYPNPSTGLFNVDLDDVGPISLSLFSLKGQVLQTIEYQDYEDSIMLDLSNFSKGIYLLKITSDKSITYKKIIVN